MDNDIVITEIFNGCNLLFRTFYDCLGSDTAVFFKQWLFKGPQGNSSYEQMNPDRYWSPLSHKTRNSTQTSHTDGSIFPANCVQRMSCNA